MGLNDGWAELAITHPGFGRIVMRRQRHAPLLLTQSAVGSFLHPCFMFTLFESENEWQKTEQVLIPLPRASKGGI